MHQPVPRAQCGVSLIEIMVGLLIGTFLLVGVLQLHVGTRESYRLSEGMARLQESARYLAELLGRELRQAGHFGCDPGGADYAGAARATNTLLGTAGVVGFEGGVSTFPAIFGTTRPGTDGLIVRYAGGDIARVKKHEVWSFGLGAPLDPPRLYTSASHGFSAEDALVIASPDCRHVGIFCVTNDPAQAMGVIEHDSGIRNCTPALWGAFQCQASGSVGVMLTHDMAYPPGSVLSALSASGYFIRPSATAAGQPPTLFRVAIDGCSGTVEEELVEGVEDMQLRYGLDLDGDRIADRHRTADAVVNWAQVVSVQVDILLRSLPTTDDPQGGRLLVGSRQTLSVAGTATTFDDGYLRVVERFTINLRNRVP